MSGGKRVSEGWSGSELSPLPNDDFHVSGGVDSAVTLTEFGDYQCPYCGRAYAELKRVFDHFGDRLRFEFRNFPLVQMHQYAELAAEAAEAAGQQGKFWQMHDGLYENQRDLSPQMIERLAMALGLDIDQFNKDVNARANLPRIKSDVEAGMQAGVQGTPSFYINGQAFSGEFDSASLIRAIEQAMRG